MQSTITRFFHAPRGEGSRVILARFHPLQESPQPQTQEGRCFPLPCPGSLAPTETGAPLRALKAASEVLSARRKGGLSAFPAGDPRWPLPPPHLPDTPLFQAGKVANVHPFPNTPPCAPIPRREAKPGRTFLSAAARSPAGVAASKPKAKRKRDPAAPPSPAARSSPSPHHPRAPRARRCPPRAATSTGSEKASPQASGAPTGAGPRLRARAGQGRPPAGRRCGQERRLPG